MPLCSISFFSAEFTLAYGSMNESFNWSNSARAYLDLLIENATRFLDCYRYLKKNLPFRSWLISSRTCSFLLHLRIFVAQIPSTYKAKGLSLLFKFVKLSPLVYFCQSNLTSNESSAPQSRVRMRSSAPATESPGK
jgi:hypothetical protein